MHNLPKLGRPLRCPPVSKWISKLLPPDTEIFSTKKEMICQAMEILGGNLNCSFHLVICRLGEGNGNPLQYSCLENPMDRGAW